MKQEQKMKDDKNKKERLSHSSCYDERSYRSIRSTFKNRCFWHVDRHLMNEHDHDLLNEKKNLLVAELLKKSELTSGS